jgi:uncharacterized protein DUF4129
VLPELDAGPGRDPTTIRGAAKRILSEPQFRQPPESIVDRVRHWIGSQLARLLNDALSGHLGLIGAAALVVIVGLIVWAVVRASRRIARDPSIRGIVLGGPARPPADWLREAAAYEALGDWRNALIARYRALVAELGRRGVVDEVPGRTSGEYRRDVEQALPAAAGDFGRATDLFEQSRYGDLPSGPEDAAALKQLSDHVIPGAR